MLKNYCGPMTLTNIGIYSKGRDYTHPNKIYLSKLLKIRKKFCPTRNWLKAI